MRILFVNYEYPPLGGGGGILNAWLAAELAERRHEVTVLTSRAFDLPSREISDGVQVIRSQTFFRRHAAAANIPSMATFMLSCVRAGRALLRNGRFDVVNTHFALPSGPVGMYLSRSIGVPNVLSIHGGDLYDPSKWLSPHRHAVMRACIRRIVENADAVVGQSHNTNENLQRYYSSSTVPRLIPLGIPKPAAPVAGRAALGLAADAIVLITIGRLVGRKRTDQLIQMVRQLHDPRIRLVVLGDGPDLEGLQKLAARLGVADQVKFPGFVPEQEKIDLLAAADLYVSTSQHEGFGLVFLEAMAQGLPVVCYDYGGQTDFLQNGVHGRLIPLNDLHAFTATVRELVEDVERRRTMAAANRREVQRYYIETCADQYEALFDDLAHHGQCCVTPFPAKRLRSAGSSKSAHPGIPVQHRK